MVDHVDKTRDRARFVSFQWMTKLAQLPAPAEVKLKPQTRLVTMEMEALSCVGFALKPAGRNWCLMCNSDTVVSTVPQSAPSKQRAETWHEHNWKAPRGDTYCEIEDHRLSRRQWQAYMA